MSANRPKMPPPHDPETGKPLPMREQPGYYPGFSTMAQKEYWDQATREKVEARVNAGKELAFLSAGEADTLEAIMECMLPQSDRDPSHRIPVVHMIDARLASKSFDGFIYEGCPEADVAHKLGIQAMESIAAAVHHKRFSELTVIEREALLLSLKEGKPPGDGRLWRELPPKYYFALLLQDAVSAYYAHPFAWDEIGYGGPAYPRGYMRPTEGKPEHWEVDEMRYAWAAPAESQSDNLRPNENLFPQSYLRRAEKE